MGVRERVWVYMDVSLCVSGRVSVCVGVSVCMQCMCVCVNEGLIALVPCSVHRWTYGIRHSTDRQTDRHINK